MFHIPNILDRQH